MVVIVPEKVYLSVQSDEFSAAIFGRCKTRLLSVGILSNTVLLMNVLLIVLTTLFMQDSSVPFKPNEEFEVKLRFDFKDRLRADPNKVDLDQTRKEYERSRGSGPLPYLFLDFRFLKQQQNEVRVRVLENNTKVVYNKKIDINTILKLELGFTDDIKDRVGAYEFTVLSLDDQKQPVSRVVIYFQEDGTYLVNGQMRGKI